MRINWKVRIKNKAFWVTIIPTVLLLLQQVLAIFGISLDYSTVSEQLLAVVGTIFVILSILGIVNDPTTENLSDSEQALRYTVPRKNED